ncbi:MAG TPA: LLM class flavin-dependent oxidoreductase [Bryobacteraceae bacterium]|jgi:alkanesulfonate monooxygenase|nr:LLM class flavin-dependent oxidoreductase [Bryobacteraceae bacterium]
MSTNSVPATDRSLYPTVGTGLQVFSTCPSSHVTPDNYRERVIAAARWSEHAGCAGTLIYTDNTLVDPWMVAQLVVENTSNLCPLVAVQPVYMHPYSAAKMVATVAFLYGRKVFLNMVAGGFKNDLLALNDNTPHDSRYERLIEYTSIIRQLLEQRSVTFEGRFYQVRGLSLNPRVPPELFPGILVSGSSEAGMAAAREMGAIAVKYPEPPSECATVPRTSAIPCGVRIGIVARASEDAAWQAAYERFPEDRKGRLTRQLATKISDSSWHKRLSEISGSANGAYWLHPFENYQTNCPYLVGSYETVSEELRRYMSHGYLTYILDIPQSQEEFEHTAACFDLARQGAAA